LLQLRRAPNAVRCQPSNAPQHVDKWPLDSTPKRRKSTVSPSRLPSSVSASIHSH
jgi:hypothetical protein